VKFKCPAHSYLALMMEAVCTSETWVNFNVTTWHSIAEDSKLHTCSCENQKSHKCLGFCLYFTLLTNTFCGARTHRFITVFTRACHRSLSSANLIHSILPQPISLRSILIPSSHLCLGLPSGLFPSGFPTKTLYTLLSHKCHMSCPPHSP
jgi:hypothetical protein